MRQGSYPEQIRPSQSDNAVLWKQYLLAFVLRIEVQLDFAHPAWRIYQEMKAFLDNERLRLTQQFVHADEQFQYPAIQKSALETHLEHKYGLYTSINAVSRQEDASILRIVLSNARASAHS